MAKAKGVGRKLYEVSVELTLDDRVFEEQLGQDLTSTQATAKGMEKVWEKLRSKSDKEFNLTRKSYQNMLKIVRDSHQSTQQDILRAERIVRKKLEQLDRQQYGVQKTHIQKLGTAWVNLATKIYIAERAMWTIVGVARLISKPFEKGFMAVEDFKQSVASMAAMVVTFSQRKPGESMAQQWERALNYSKAMVPILENIAAVTLLSGQQTTALANALARSGVFLQANNKAQIEGFRRLANALPLMTKGQDIMRQINTEIRALFTGQGAASSMLLQTLRAIDPQIKEHLKIWRAQGKVMEHVGELLVGFGPATQLLANTWQAVKSTIDTTVTQTLRGGMEPTYRVIISYVKELNQYLLKNKKIIGYEIADVLEKTRKSLELMVSIYRGLPDGVIGATGIGIAGRIIFGGSVGKVLASLYLLNEQMAHFNLNIGSNVKKSGEISEAFRNIWDAITGKRDWRTGAFKDQSDIFKAFHDSVVYGFGDISNAANEVFMPKGGGSMPEKLKVIAKGVEGVANAYEKVYKVGAKIRGGEATLDFSEYYAKQARRAEAENKKMWERMRDNAEKAYKADQEAYLTAELARIKIDEEAKKALKDNDLAYWVGVVNNANTTEDKLRDAWQHINAIAKQNNISAVQAFKLGWKDATRQFKTDSMIWLEVGRNTAQTLQKDFSDYFFNAFEGHLKSLKDFWKGIWNDMKAIFLRAIADMLANKLVKAFFSGEIFSGLFSKIPILGSLFGSLANSIGQSAAAAAGLGAAANQASGSIAGLLGKIPGIGSALSKVAGFLGLGGGASAAAGTVGAGAGVTGGATLALSGGTTAAGATAAGLGMAASIGATMAVPIGAVALAKKVFGHHHMSQAEIVAQDLDLLRKYYGVTNQADYLARLKQYAGNYPTSFIGWGREIGWTSKTDKGWEEINKSGVMNYHTGYNVPSWIPKHHDGYYPSSGEHLAVIRNDETVLTPKQVSSVERAVNAPINLAIKIVTESGKVLMDKVVSELKTRSSNGEIVLYTEGLTAAEG